MFTKRSDTWFFKFIDLFNTDKSSAIEYILDRFGINTFVISTPSGIVIFPEEFIVKKITLSNLDKVKDFSDFFFKGISKDGIDQYIYNKDIKYFGYTVIGKGSETEHVCIYGSSGKKLNSRELEDLKFVSIYIFKFYENDSNIYLKFLDFLSKDISPYSMVSFFENVLNTYIKIENNGDTFSNIDTEIIDMPNEKLLHELHKKKAINNDYGNSLKISVYFDRVNEKTIRKILEIYTNIFLKENSNKLLETIKNLEEEVKRKDNIMSITAHELRTPATVIKNAIALIFDTHLDDGNPSLTDKLEMIKESADRGMNILNTLLETSRINTNRMELVLTQVNIKRIMELATEEFQIEAKRKNLTLIFTPINDIPAIFADPVRLREVIDNLVQNAIKYSDKGTIELSVEKVPQFIKISIKDEGRGIKEEEKNDLFKMFHRIDNIGGHQGGLGLGLYIIKNIVDLHKGEIEVDSTYGVGTKFTIILPDNLKPNV